MMSLSCFEFRASRYSGDHALRIGVNNSLPHFLNVSSDLDKMYAVSLNSSRVP